MKAKLATILCMFAGLWLAHNSVFAHPSYSNVVVFGDSLSDPGNAFVLTGQFSVPPYTLIPTAPYARGGMHFSNGKTWAELLSKDLKQASGPAFRNPGKFDNYAVGGARARSVTGADLTDQVNLYLGNNGNAADPDALYVILIGGNDLRDAIAAFQSDPTGAASTQILQAALTSVADNIQSLAASGAHYFLIGNAPNLALVPAVAQQGGLAQFIARMLSQQYNGGLDTVESRLTGVFGLNVSRLDLYSLLQSLVSHPEQLDLDNVTDSCIRPGVITGAVCHDTDDYLFWDGIHPTHTVHAFLARQALKALH